MLNEGLVAMAVGMGTVFAFLAVLWLSVFCMSKVVAYLNRIFPTVKEVAVTTANNVVGDLEVAIAIATAKLKR